jgi:hypothetical protein
MEIDLFRNVKTTCDEITNFTIDYSITGAVDIPEQPGIPEYF